MSTPIPLSIDPAMDAAKALTSPGAPQALVEGYAEVMRAHYEPLLQQVATSFGYLASITTGEDGYPNARRIGEALDTLAGLNALLAVGKGTERGTSG